MYGTTASSGVAGTALAMTGLTVGSSILLAIGVIFIGIGIYLLIKKNSKARP